MTQDKKIKVYSFLSSVEIRYAIVDFMNNGSVQMISMTLKKFRE